jgi:predicted metal-dependent phosphoesterase TrpH/glycosyltransferase involved in cell wall biosynthesis
MPRHRRVRGSWNQSSKGVAPGVSRAARSSEDGPFAIAQVTPYAWEARRETNEYVAALSEALANRGHSLLVVTPSGSRSLVRESRRLIRAAASAPHSLLQPGSVRTLAMGQSLPVGVARRGGTVSLPIDVARTIERLLSAIPLDFVHVHEPFAPSASAAALRHSRALNVGSFHSPTERVLSTQVARRFIELFFGRLDGRTATFDVTRELIERFFPGDYEVVPPGVELDTYRPSRPATGVEIAFAAEEERGALRLFLRALRRLPVTQDWRVTIWAPRGDELAPRLGRALRERVRFVTAAQEPFSRVLERSHAICVASTGLAPATQALLKAMAAGVVPVATRIPVYEEILHDGEEGLFFEPGDVAVLAAQLTRIVGDEELRSSLRRRCLARREQLGWDRVAEQVEGLYQTVAGRRHSPTGDPAVRRRLARRGFIHCDLHMHTDHSPDCATPVELLLETAKRRGLGAIAVTDHNEISGALAARERADGIKVIVSEEIKTAHEGEVIGLFIEEKIPRGMSMKETIDAIHAQGGLAYVPHPFDRLHSVPDYEHLLKVVESIDILEVFNARVAVSAFNEEAARFAAKYRVVAGAGSDSHVPQGLGSVKIKLRDFESAEEFLESLRDADILRKRKSLIYLQSLKFLQRARPPRSRAARRPRASQRSS